MTTEAHEPAVLDAQTQGSCSVRWFQSSAGDQVIPWQFDRTLVGVLLSGSFVDPEDLQSEPYTAGTLMMYSPGIVSGAAFREPSEFLWLEPGSDWSSYIQTASSIERRRYSASLPLARHLYLLPGDYAAPFIDGLVLSILQAFSKKSVKMQEKSARTIRKVVEKLKASSIEDEQLMLDELAQEVGLHPAHLSRLFRQQTGTTISRLRGTFNALRAADMIRGGQESMRDIALEAGFYDQSHLTRSFRSTLGMTPGQYRATFQAAA